MEIITRLTSYADISFSTIATYVFSWVVSIVANFIAKNWIILALTVSIIILIFRPLLKVWRNKKIMIAKYDLSRSKDHSLEIVQEAKTEIAAIVKDIRQINSNKKHQVEQLYKDEQLSLEQIQQDLQTEIQEFIKEEETYLKTCQEMENQFDRNMQEITQKTDDFAKDVDEY